MGMRTGSGMEIYSAGMDGDRDRIQQGQFGTDLNFTGTDGMGTNVRPHAGLYCMTGMYALFHMEHMVVYKCHLHKPSARNP